MNTRPTSAASETLQLERPEVTLGWLLSPPEFARECASTLRRPPYESWAMGIHLPDAVVRLIESPLVPVGSSLALFSSSAGPLYPVAVFQAGAMQVRAMQSLADWQTQQWFKETVTTGRMCLAIEVAETAQLAVAEGHCEKRTLAEAEEQIQKCVKLEGERRLMDELQLAQRLAEPSTVKSVIPGFEVQEVRLVLVSTGGGHPHESDGRAKSRDVIH